MANDINSVVLIGRLTRDSEMRYTSAGTAVSRFTLAVNRYAGSNKSNEVSFIDCAVWGKQAEAINPYLSKGKQVAVQGELRQSRWEQDGQNRSKVEVSVASLQLLGSTQEGGYKAPQQAQSYSSPSTTSYAQKEPVQPSFPGPEQFDDDIPF